MLFLQSSYVGFKSKAGSALLSITSQLLVLSVFDITCSYVNVTVTTGNCNCKDHVHIVILIGLRGIFSPVLMSC